LPFRCWSTPSAGIESFERKLRLLTDVRDCLQEPLCMHAPPVAQDDDRSEAARGLRDKLTGRRFL
jgi:hypothetical protein